MLISISIEICRLPHYAHFYGYGWLIGSPSFIQLRAVKV